MYKDIFSSLERKFNVQISFPTSIGEVSTPSHINIQAQLTATFLNKLFFTLRLDHLFYENKNILIRPGPADHKLPYHWFECSVKEKDSDLPVSNILLHTEDWEYAVFTDENGWAGLKIPENTGDIVFQLYSFNYLPQTIIFEPENQVKTIFVELQENKLPPLTIFGKKIPYFYVNDQGIVLTHSANKTHPAKNIFGNDPTKQIQMLAGVFASDDKSSAIKIRGATEESTLLIVDQMPVYKIDHLLGIFSALNGDYYDDWRLYKNFIPIQHGGKTGGMAEFESDKAKNKLESKVNVNFLYGSLVAKTNFQEKIGFQIGLRKSFNSGLTEELNNFSSRNTFLTQPGEGALNRGLVISQPDFQFFDGQSKVWFALNSKNTLCIDGFLSSDKMDNYYKTNYRNSIFLFEEKQQLKKDWYNETYALSHRYSGKKYDLITRVYSTGFEENSFLSVDIQRKGPLQIFRDSVSNLSENRVSDFGVKTLWQHKGQNPFFTGFEGIFYKNNLYMEEGQSPLFEINRTASLFSAFGGKKWNVNKSWMVETDMRISYVDHIKKFWFLPQLRLVHRSSRFTWQSGISRYKQAIRMLEFENFFGQRSTFFVLANDTSIPVSESWNSFTAITLKKGIFTASAEVYYRKSLGNVFLSRNVAQLTNRNRPAGPTDLRLFRGEGRYYGIDIGLITQKGGWMQNIQYSLSKSENKFINFFQNEYFPATDDSRHQWKIQENFDFAPWHFQTSFIFASGRPYTDVNEVLADRESVNLQDIMQGEYQNTLPDYFRWDAAISFTIPLKKENTVAFEISCFNILNRANVRYRQFFYQLPNSVSANAILGNDVSQLGRTFNLSGIFNFVSK